MKLYSKLIVFLTIFFTPSVLYSDDLCLPLNGTYDTALKIKFDEPLHFTAWENNNTYDITIHHYYYSYFLCGKYSYACKEIKSYHVNKFKEELMNIKFYYDKWAKVAIENNVDYIEKSIPVEIKSFDALFCEAYPDPPEVNTRVYFKVINHKPYCVIASSMGKMGPGFEVDEWYLDSEDIMNIINEFDNVITKKRKFIDQKREKENLFK